ncbi:MAG: efflux RND transporter periplasmic adaptor subunit [Bacteroidales bacterium]
MNKNLKINLKLLTIFLLIITFLFISSCKKRDSRLLLYKVEKKDFVNKITVYGVIEAKKTTAVICPSIHTDATIIYLVPEGTHVKKGDTLCILESSEISTQYLKAVKELDNEIAEFNKSLAHLELQYIILKSQLKIIESSTAIRKLDSLQLEFLSPSKKRIMELEIEKAVSEKEKYQKKLAFLEIINQSDLQKMKMKIIQRENKVNIVKSRAEKLIIRSDTEGMVFYSNLWSSGEKIREGDIVWDWMEFFKIPDMTGMKVKLYVNETHYKQIENDQRVEITIDSHPEKKLGGKVKSKSSVGKPVKKDSKIKQYEITAALDSADFIITSGLSVTCNVYLDEIHDTIVVPVIAVHEFDSAKFVYITQKDKFIKQVVKTSKYSNTETIITSGLKGGESVALGEPPLSLIDNTETKDNISRYQ